MKEGESIRVHITKSIDDKIIYSIFECDKGTLLVSDILPCTDFLNGLKKMILKNNKK